MATQTSSKSKRCCGIKVHYDLDVWMWEIFVRHPFCTIDNHDGSDDGRIQGFETSGAAMRSAKRIAKTFDLRIDSTIVKDVCPLGLD